MIRQALRQARAARELEQTERNLVWLASSPRSGSTWLLNMLGREPRVVMIDEPHIGLHLGLWTAEVLRSSYGDFEPDRQLMHEARAGEHAYFFAEDFRDSWGPPLRAMVLARFRAHAERYGARVPAGAEPIICVKEPNGTQGLGVLASVTPRSRFLHLVRDARDVVVSHLDAYRGGTWLAESFSTELGDVSREDRIREFAIKWRIRVQVARAAYERHDPDRRLEIRYEDLRAEPLLWTTRAYEWVGLPTGAVPAVVEATAFEKLPAAKRGAGKFTRKAQPGEWREALSQAEQDLVWELCGDTLSAVGYTR